MTPGRLAAVSAHHSRFAWTPTAEQAGSSRLRGFIDSLGVSGPRRRRPGLVGGPAAFLGRGRGRHRHRVDAPVRRRDGHIRGAPLDAFLGRRKTESRAQRRDPLGTARTGPHRGRLRRGRRRDPRMDIRAPRTRDRVRRLGAALARRRSGRQRRALPSDDPGDGLALPRLCLARRHRRPALQRLWGRRDRLAPAGLRRQGSGHC